MVNWPTRDHVGDARARDRAHQRRRDHAHLARARPRAAEQPHRHVVEELDHAGALQEGAEQDEQEDVGRRDTGRRAVDALGAERHMLDDLLERIAAVVERSRQQCPERGNRRGIVPAMMGSAGAHHAARPR